MVDITQMFAAMVKEEASDLFLKVGVRPSMRVVGRVIPMNFPEMTEEDLLEVYNDITAVTEPPTANPDGFPGDLFGYTTPEDDPFTTPNVLGNDTDPDVGDMLSVTGIDTPEPWA